MSRKRKAEGPGKPKTEIRLPVISKHSKPNRKFSTKIGTAQHKPNFLTEPLPERIRSLPQEHHFLMVL